MSDNEKDMLKELCIKGCTDSDVEDFCRNNRISVKDAFYQIAEWSVPDCCKGCKHIEMYDRMFPCNVCSRPKRDYYESA